MSFLAAEYEQAVENFTTFLARFPNHNGATRYLAATYLATGDWDRVIRTLNPAQGEELPGHPATLSLLAQAFRTSGNFNRAIKVYERALEIVPKQPDLTLGLATTRFAAGDTAVAILVMENLIQDVPEFHSAQMELVRMYVGVGSALDSLTLADGLQRQSRAVQGCRISLVQC